MKGIILILSLAFTITSCTDPKQARKTLLDSGLHPIEVGGWDAFGCSESDFYSTKFKAYSPDSSRVVTGCVCGGIFFKNNTIRFD